MRERRKLDGRTEMMGIGIGWASGVGSWRWRRWRRDVGQHGLGVKLDSTVPEKRHYESVKAASAIISAHFCETFV
jgi:hypothetical protein